MTEQVVAVTTEHDPIDDMSIEARYKANEVSWGVSSESDQGMVIPNQEKGIKESIMMTQGVVQDEGQKGKKNTIGKGCLSTWKLVARGKENVVPMMEIKKRLFKDLTNGKGGSNNGEASNTKKARHESGEDESRSCKRISKTFTRSLMEG
ncbi:uncharacterized protein G2W53_015352 [Senna tora]|uniref:Uncharacterized protein n=1 Tax=Senna tora TaxID=362788 RepID=A0A834WV79_9FABA|nr:uncharacterized protein G2W53_015352 [Senna tora]